MRELHRAGDTELGEAREVLRCEALRVLDPLAQAARRPFVLRRLERVERLAVGAVADRVHPDRPARSGGRAHDLRELVTARDANPRAVEHPRGLRAERTVHEHLQVAEAQEVVPEAGADPERLELRQLLVRERLPHAKSQPSVVAESLEDRGCADPAVLVVNGCYASAMSELHTRARHLQPVVLRDGREPLAEPPRRLLSQDPGRLAGSVALHDATFDLEISPVQQRGPPSSATASGGPSPTARPEFRR